MADQPSDDQDQGDLFDLGGRVAVITGGSRGIGRAIAETFADHGAATVIASRKDEVCRAVAAEIEEKCGCRSMGIGFHAGSWEECDALFEAVAAEFGSVDILVNNAGMSPLYSSIEEISEQLFDKVVGVNFKGPFRLSARFGTAMAAGDGGSIINITSISALQPRPGEVVYGAAKAALSALSTAFAHAFGPKVRVNAIMPGPIMTDVTAAWDMEEFNQVAEEEIPLGRGGEPGEVAGAALYLASDAASYTTGAVLKVDGGTAWGTS